MNSNVWLGMVSVSWVKESAILTTVCAAICFAVLMDMWPAWLIMTIGAWGHYCDALITSKRNA